MHAIRVVSGSRFGEPARERHDVLQARSATARCGNQIYGVEDITAGSIAGPPPPGSTGPSPWTAEDESRADLMPFRNQSTRGVRHRCQIVFGGAKPRLTSASNRCSTSSTWPSRGRVEGGHCGPRREGRKPNADKRRTGIAFRVVDDRFRLNVWTTRRTQIPGSSAGRRSAVGDG